jgi:aspartyl-tRNA(Asn)/glutamyl-tRNA(Gln) amidotransferase subunit A
VKLDRRKPDFGRLRAALIPTDFAKTPGAEPEVGAAFDAAVGTLRSMGLHIETAALPDMPASELTTAILYAEAISAFEPFFRDGSVRELHDPYARYQAEVTAELTGADYLKASRMRTVLQERMAQFFGTYDVIVATNFLSVAPSIHEDFTKTLPYPDPVGAVGNGCGLPAIALPCGHGRGGLPVSFQLMGSAFDEGLLLDLGEAYQATTRHHLDHPPVGA